MGSVIQRHARIFRTGSSSFPSLGAADPLCVPKPAITVLLDLLLHTWACGVGFSLFGSDVLQSAQRTRFLGKSSSSSSQSSSESTPMSSSSSAGACGAWCFLRTVTKRQATDHVKSP